MCKKVKKSEKKVKKKVPLSPRYIDFFPPYLLLKAKAFITTIVAAQDMQIYFNLFVTDGTSI